MKIFLRIAAAIVTVVAVSLSLIAIVGIIDKGQKLWQLLYPILILMACGIYWFLEFDFRSGTIGIVLQNKLMYFLGSVIIVSIGIIFIYSGLSELSEPVIFSYGSRFARTFELVIQNIRMLIGSTGLAMLFIGFGIFIVIEAIRMLSRKFRSG